MVTNEITRKNKTMNQEIDKSVDEIGSEALMLSPSWGLAFRMALFALLPSVLIDRALTYWLEIPVVSFLVVLFFVVTCLQHLPGTLRTVPEFNSMVFTAYIWIGRIILVGFVVIVSAFSVNLEGIFFWVWLIGIPIFLGALLLKALWYGRKACLNLLFPSIKEIIGSVLY